MGFRGRLRAWSIFWRAFGALFAPCGSLRSTSAASCAPVAIESFAYTFARCVVTVERGVGKLQDGHR